METKHHQFAIPNTFFFGSYECDLLSATRAWLLHEYEVKVHKEDFYRDFSKRKHLLLEKGYERLVANYFWFTTCGFELNEEEIPRYAGWIELVPPETSYDYYQVQVRKKAPRLHSKKMREGKRLDVNRWLSYKLKDLYHIHYIRSQKWNPVAPAKTSE